MKKSIKESRSIFEKNDIYKKLDSFNAKMLDANFWQDKIESKNIVKEKKLYEDLINSLNESNQKLKDLDELNLLAIEENNLDMQK